MLATVKLLGSNQEATKVIAEQSTVIQIPWLVVSLIVIYFIGLWVCLFIDGLTHVFTYSKDREGEWLVAIFWPLIVIILAGMGLGILIKYLCKKIPKTVKNFFFYCSLPFRPIKAGELLSKKVTKEEKKTPRTIVTDNHWATFGEDGRITSLRRS